MIVHIPALLFLQDLMGTYGSADGMASLSFIRVGYGHSIELRLGGKVQLAGVVGVSGNSVELFAQIGLPNVVRLRGQLRAQNELGFESSDMSFGLSFVLENDTLALGISSDEDLKTNYVFQRV
jgi:hypothetical protein